MPMPAAHRCPQHVGHRSDRAFTLVEMLVVMGIIALLIAILVPALAGGLKTAHLANSQARLKQIATWMQSYSQENRDHVVPSRFDYAAAAANYPVKVRSYDPPPTGNRYQGTWTDILWMYSGIHAHLPAYEFDSPDAAFYRNSPDYDSPFRSSALNSRDYVPGDGVPIGMRTGAVDGTGAHESGQPGYFAANNFFNVDPADEQVSAPLSLPPKWYTTGQIKAPERSVYLVDSVAGEIIRPDPAVPGGPWYNPAAAAGGGPAIDLQVDYRYNGACLMLFLDGHSSAEGPWLDLDELETARKIKVRNLTQN